MNKSLLDSDFDITEDDPDEKKGAEDEIEAQPDPDTDGDDDLVVEVEDDTPEEDRDKWVASDDEPDIEDPDEDEVKQYSKSVQKRIQKQTARIHAERRRADQRDREANEAAATARALLEENNRLKDMLEHGEKAFVDEHKSHLDAALAAAQRAWREASEADDVDAQATAMQEIARLASQKASAEQRQFQPLPRQRPEDLLPPQAHQPTVDDRAAEWQEKNKWFMRNEVMTATAMGLHTDLTQNKGVLPDDDRYYTIIDAEMRKRFPEEFGITPEDKKPKRRRSPVASARRGDAATRRKVTLTESQQRIAKRMGVSNEQYASAMLEVERNERDA